MITNINIFIILLFYYLLFNLYIFSAELINDIAGKYVKKLV